MIADQKRERVRVRRALDQRRLEGLPRLDQLKSGLPCAMVASLNVCLTFIFHSEFANWDVLTVICGPCHVLIIKNKASTRQW